MTVSAKAERRGDGGFSTLEVLISLVILSAGLLPLMDAQFELQRMAARLEQIDRENAALSLALRYMRDINPSQRPRGEYLIGSSRLRWQSRLAAPDTEFSTALRGDRRRTLALYDVGMLIDLENGTRLQRTIRLTGWSIADDPNGLSARP